MASGTYRRWREHDEQARAQLHLVATGQGGVITPRDALDAGVDETTFRRLVDRGTLRRLRRGMYADIAVLDASTASHEMRHLLDAAAIVRTLPAGAATTGATGALAWGLPLPRGALEVVQVWRPPDQDHRAAPDARSTVFTLDPGRVQHVAGLAVVPAAVAAVHATFDVPGEWGVVLLDAALHQGLATVHDLRDASEMLWSVPGHGRVAWALSRCREGSESPLESLSRVTLVRRGVPEPRLQVPLHDGDGFIGRVDMLIDEWGVIGEADGAGKYAGREALVAEKRREDRLRALGFEVVRWMWDEILARPDEVVARLHEAARRSARRPSQPPARVWPPAA